MEKLGFESTSIIPKDTEKRIKSGLSRDKDHVDLETARRILEEVKNFPETDFTDSSDLSRVGQYNANEIKQAFAIVAADIVGKSSMDKKDFSPPQTIKHTPYGEKKIVLNYTIDTKTDPPTPVTPSGIWLSLTKDNKTIDMSLSLEDIMPGSSGWKGQAAMLAFQDDRTGFGVTGYDLYKKGSESSTDTFRKLFRGMRWVAANLINWNEGFILPEDLDSSKFPSRNTPQLPSRKE